MKGPKSKCRAIPAFVCAALLLAVLTVPAAPAAAADEAERHYGAAARRFHELRTDPKANAVQWQGVAADFERVHHEFPHHRRGPDALFSAGLAYRRAHLVSHLAEPLSRAVESFHRFVATYPDHALADDCLVHIGEIFDEAFDDPHVAYLEYRKVMELYPEGDQVALARERTEALRPRLKAAEAEAARSVGAAPERDARRPAPPARTGDAVTLKRIQHVTTPEWTRVILTLSGEVDYRHARLPARGGNGPRLYIDLPATRPGESLGKALGVADGRLERIRVGRHDPHALRVVLDLDQVDQHEVRAFDLPLETKVVIDLHPGPGAEPVAMPVPDPEIEPLDPETALSLNRALGLKVRTVVLDPGHGGHDPGAAAFGLEEKDITLAIAKRLRDVLARRRPDLRVVLTREDDRFIRLSERPRIAQRVGADLFVSIHINAHDLERISGVETYFLNLTSDAASLKVAARENAAADKQVGDLNAILMDLLRDTNIIESGALAKNMQDALVQTLRGGHRVRDLGVKQAPFMVLLGSDVPSVLVEAGFITNRSENRRLQQDTYLDRIAEGIFAGLSSYIAQQTVASNGTPPSVLARN